MGATPRTLTLPVGVYSPDDIVDELEAQMIAHGTQVYDVEYSNLTGKLSLTAPNPFKFMFLGSSANEIVGLTANTIPANNLRFQNPIDLTGTKMVLITSQNIRSDDVVLAGEESLNVLAAIPITQETQTVLCSQNNFDSDFIDTESGLVSTVDIQLLDSATLRPLNLNGKGFTIVLDCSSSGFTDDS
ncbi:hypothetical protein PhCBS80983_g06297 [Powellomyces hirtus]|uniref:Uncharacterized protein n=1 Tax=Powellomyces hirtus TaxID=109895 RepID=A0A507DPH8_9FUNG|nr:hypothetical protein PhCBS80983_g06297 [Powellomyces hirtus]